MQKPSQRLAGQAEQVCAGFVVIRKRKVVPDFGTERKTFALRRARLEASREASSVK